MRGLRKSWLCCALMAAACSDVESVLPATTLQLGPTAGCNGAEAVDTATHRLRSQRFSTPRFVAEAAVAAWDGAKQVSRRLRTKASSPGRSGDASASRRATRRRQQPGELLVECENEACKNPVQSIKRFVPSNAHRRARFFQALIEYNEAVNHRAQDAAESVRLELNGLRSPLCEVCRQSGVERPPTVGCPAATTDEELGNSQDLPPPDPASSAALGVDGSDPAAGGATSSAGLSSTCAALLEGWRHMTRSVVLSFGAMCDALSSRLAALDARRSQLTTWLVVATTSVVDGAIFSAEELLDAGLSAATPTRCGCTCTPLPRAAAACALHSHALLLHVHAACVAPCPLAWGARGRGMRE